MNTKLKTLLGLTLLALVFMPLFAFAQTNNLIGSSSDSSSVTGSPYGDAGAIIAVLMVVGGILKNAFPDFPNRFVPLITWLIGTFGYMLMTGASWGDGKAWFNAFMVAASATGIHSGIKNTFQNQEVVDAAKKVGVILLFGLMSLSFVGCQNAPVQVKAGADPIIVHAEWTAENALNVFDNFLAWDYSNPALPAGIHKAAADLRGEPGKPGRAEQSITDLRAATKVYKRAKSAETGNQVKALTEATLTLANSLLAQQGRPPLVLPVIPPSPSELMSRTNSWMRPQLTPAFAG